MENIHANLLQKTHKGKAEQRDRVDLLRSRIYLLTGKDKLLMTMYLENSNSFRQIARLTGVTETSIARRIHRITKRLIDDKYILCLRNHDKLTRTELDIAKEHFLLGIPMTKIADERDCSYYHICKIVNRIKQVINESGVDY